MHLETVYPTAYIRARQYCGPSLTRLQDFFIGQGISIQIEEYGKEWNYYIELSGEKIQAFGYPNEADCLEIALNACFQLLENEPIEIS